MVDYSAILKKGFGLSVNQTFALRQECDATIKRHSKTYFQEHHIQELFSAGDITWSEVFIFGYHNVIQRLFLLWETAQ